MMSTSCTNLVPKDFYLEVVDHLWPIGCLDVLWLRCHADMNSDLEVILLLADEGLVSCGVYEALVCAHVVGGR